MKLITTPKQWLHNLAPIAQVKLWNGYLNDGMETVVPTTLFKQVTERVLLDKFCDTLKEQGFNIEQLLESEPLNNFPYNSSQNR